MKTHIKFNNFNFFFLLYFFLIVILIPIFFYAPYLMFKKGFEFKHLSFWLISIFLPIILGKFLQTMFNIVVIKEDQLIIRRPFLFLNYGIQKESKLDLSQIKTAQKENSDALLLTTYLLKNEDNEVLEYFSCKKSKKLHLKIDSLLPFTILETAK